MGSELKRSFRKNLKLHGLIYLGGEEQEITVKNLSITGLLAELNKKTCGDMDIKDIFGSLKVSTMIDLFIPDMRMAGEAEVIRVDMQKDKILIAMEFKHLSYDVEDFIYKRKMYRKRMPGPGRILLNGEYHQFDAVNISVDGIMIHLDGTVVSESGLVTAFEFEKLGLKGEIRIIWIDYPVENGTLMGLQYVHLEQGNIQGIPRFAER